MQNNFSKISKRGEMIKLTKSDFSGTTKWNTVLYN